MRIAHVNVAKNFRGGERQTELLMRELDFCGVEQRLIARRGSPLARRVNELGLEVHEVSGHLVGVLRATGGFDLIQMHEGRSIYAGYLRHKLSGTPYVATRRVNNPIGEHYFAHRAYRNAARVVAVAPQVADVVRQFDPAVKVSVILSSSSGLSARATTVQAIRAEVGGDVIVGHVGALDNDQKAQDTIIKAARLLSDKNPSVRFILVGGGGDERMLRELAAGLNNLTFSGFVDNVGDYLGAFDILLLPSRREGIGSILLDAMEFGLPIVATPVGGVPQIVTDGVNGFFIDVDRPDQLADKIEWLAANPSLRDEMGARGRERAVGHRPSDMAAAYLELYTAILGS